MRKSATRSGIEPPGRWLFFVDDDGAVLRYRVGGAGEGDGRGGRVRIGRDSRNDIFFDHPQVPGQALVVVERDGADIVKVFEGARVLLNAVAVTGMHRLYSGDRLRLADQTFLYARDDTPPDLSVALTVLFAEEVIKCVLLRQTRVVLGRDGDLILDDPSVDERHALLECYGEDGIFVRDLGSNMGTSVDGVRLEGRARVGDGAVLTLGRVAVVVRVLAADGLGLLQPPRKRPERIDARFVEPSAATAASAAADPSVPATVIGSLAAMGPLPVPLDALEDVGPARGDGFDDDATGRYPPTDRSRPAHWSTGSTPSPVHAPASVAPPARRGPQAPPAMERRPVAEEQAPSVRLRADLVADPPRPAPRVVDGPARPSAPPPPELPAMVPVVRPGLHDIETATLDTRAVPDMVEAHYRARGEQMPAWARTGAQQAQRPPAPSPSPAGEGERYRPSQLGRATGAHAAQRSPVHSASTEPPAPPAPPGRSSGAFSPRGHEAPARDPALAGTGGHARYRPSQAAAAPSPPPVPGVQLTVGLSPLPDAPRLAAVAQAEARDEERRRFAAAARAAAPPAAPVVGYSHHDPNRLASAERPADAAPQPQGPADDARRHHRRRAVDDSPRYHDDAGSGKK